MEGRQEFKIFSLRDIRLMLGLTQEELAKLSGVAPMYVSLIENNKRNLTRQTAEKIALVVSKLLSVEEGEVKISADQLRASHVASFYPQHLQSYVGNLLYLTTQATEGIERFYQQQELPVAEQELYIKMEIVKHLADMLPKSEEPHINLDAMEALVKEKREVLEYNKEKYIKIITESDGIKGVGKQLGFEDPFKQSKYKG